MDSLRRARATKADIESNLAILKPTKKASSGRKRVEDDEENHLIKKMRQEDHMEWGAIATYLNDERERRSEPATMTAAAVYSRFVRNGPRIAIANGEIGFDPQDYMHLRHPNRYLSGKPVAANARPNKRGREEQAGQIKGNIRPKGNYKEDMAELSSVDKTELLLDAVSDIEKHFWAMVADQLEKSSGKLYDPMAIQARYHQI
ncbi:hypothetical protein BS50DRAFT_486621 [Corynespora cassiicola Philippines]|uniref:Uncharacterized protein n=1 Tax=Corynespora cassiicola Philippines TaxID=1448308 RepID=A0A2T2P1W5_CORCC|nr:hypothetical protein BS50DRAFT_486621 [Corynespora cassiicola Philippines]